MARPVLVDFILHRKAYIILAVLFALLLLFFLRTVPTRSRPDGRGSEPDVELETAQKKKVDLSWMVHPSNRQSVGVKMGEGELKLEDKLFQDKEKPFVNRGNVAMMPNKDDEDSLSSNEEPAAGPPNLSRNDNIFDPPKKEVQDVVQDHKETVSPPLSQQPPPADTKTDKPPDAGTSTTPSLFDRLYVPSSMPLGPALRMEHTERQKAVVKAFQHAWKAYKSYAWGYDELRPLSKSGTSHLFGMGMTIIDSLDTLWLMGLQEEFDEARRWVATALNINNNFHVVSLFETNIRVLGGLLSAYHLSQDDIFLQKALELGQRLVQAFNTPSGIPCPRVDMKRGLPPDFKSTQTNPAEAGTLQLEFRELSHASNNPIFQEKVDRTVKALLAASHGGLVTQTIQGGRFVGGTYSVGAAVDSYYEYMLKEWLQSGKTEKDILDYHTKTVDGIARTVVGYSEPSKMAFLGMKRNGLNSVTGYMDHLACFYPGLLALGIHHGLYPEQQSLAANLTHTCYHMYKVTSTGLAADGIGFNTDPRSSKDTITKPGDALRSVQRPETVESLFYLYQLTKESKYREWGWEIFQAFEKSTKISSGGYAELRNANTGAFDDKMESFFLAETLKYLFLLFGEDERVLSLDEWVFNTEAHPLRIWRTS